MVMVSRRTGGWGVAGVPQRIEGKEERDSLAPNRDGGLEQSKFLSGSTKMKSIAQDRSLKGSHVVKLEIESINWSQYCI